MLFIVFILYAAINCDQIPDSSMIFFSPGILRGLCTFQQQMFLVFTKKYHPLFTRRWYLHWYSTLPHWIISLVSEWSFGTVVEWGVSPVWLHLSSLCATLCLYTTLLNMWCSLTLPSWLRAGLSFGRTQWHGYLRCQPREARLWFWHDEGAHSCPVSTGVHGLLKKEWRRDCELVRWGHGRWSAGFGPSVGTAGVSRHACPGNCSFIQHILGKCTGPCWTG